MMKVLLLQPPVQDFYDTDIRLQPLGLCSLKAAVKRYLPGVEVVVKDYHHGFGKRTEALPPELSYLAEYYREQDSSPFSTFHRYYHFGATFADIGADVERERPDLVGISSLFSPYHREALSCARQVRARLGAPVIMGGPHISACALSVLSDPAVDFVIRGEGERPLVEFLKAFRAGGNLGGVPNLGFKREGKPILNPLEKNYDLDDLPFPDFSDLPADRYLFGRRPLCFLTTTRGCPHRCSFCSVHLTFQEGFRRRSPEGVVTEIRERYAQGYRVFDFEDDNLSFHRGGFARLLSLLIEEFSEGDILLTAMNGISYLSLDRDILTLMKRAGFRDLNISLVSAEEASLSTLGRPHTVGKYLEVVREAQALGFDIVSYQILGLPFETLETMEETMALTARLPVLLGVSTFYLTPGSPLAGDLPGQSQADIFRARSTAMAVETARFCRDDLHTLFITGRIINFLKGLPVRGEGVTIREALEVASHRGKRAKTGADLLTGLLAGKGLCAATPQGLKPLHRFRDDLFFRVMEKAGCVRTRQGAVIDLAGISEP